MLFLIEHKAQLHNNPDPDADNHDCFMTETIDSITIVCLIRQISQFELSTPASIVSMRVYTDYIKEFEEIWMRKHPSNPDLS
jgi:hypothetical protein